MLTRTCMSFLVLGLAALIVSAAPSSFAAQAPQVEIRDPNRILQGPFFLGHRPEFAKSFTCGQPLTLFTKVGRCRVHCEYGMCEQLCKSDTPIETLYQAEECGEEQVSVYSSLGAEFSVFKSDYEASSNSMALSLIQFLTTFYEHIEVISIDQVIPTLNKALIENGKMTKLFLTTVSLSLFPDKAKPESISVVLMLDLNRAGLDQVMCLADHGCEPRQDYFLKRKGLVNATF